jgi:hypothetical protein
MGVGEQVPAYDHQGRIVGWLPLADSDTAHYRQEICRGCDRLEEIPFVGPVMGFFGADLSQYRCRECGCPIVSKTRVATSTCPIGKW